MSKEAMKLALEALELEDMACRYAEEPTPEHIAKAITALREALAEQPAQQQPAWRTQGGIPRFKPQPAQQQPVAEITAEDMGRPFNAIRINTHFYKEIPPVGTKLYTRPQAREPLTDEQIIAIGKELGLKCRLGGNPNIDFDYVRAIEAAHGIKGDA
jgi:hypothetical protein